MSPSPFLTLNHCHLLLNQNLRLLQSLLQNLLQRKFLLL
jgi:hypothetical protein